MVRFIVMVAPGPGHCFGAGCDSCKLVVVRVLIVVMVIMTHTLPAKEKYDNSTILFPQNISQELFANLQ